MQFAGRPCERKNVEMLDFLKFSPDALVYGEAKQKERGDFSPPHFTFVYSHKRNTYHQEPSQVVLLLRFLPA